MPNIADSNWSVEPPVQQSPVPSSRKHWSRRTSVEPVSPDSNRPLVFTTSSLHASYCAPIFSYLQLW
eukprot:CAMPEP_0204277764 /NCGR_PEP_ID=MMETSP0468-20130131/29491_1 /ASSEMBLY_ACC=CAM_ASM_000383 /TAXON_ID=2969 /ORGANISM="Oxyrrhis marina" /LENGTH=66 /DNA_ID=CAMNT_0051254595 /DNA_START=44 /DNA_END=244 /DNA_ORIENTATION=+